MKMHDKHDGMIHFREFIGTGTYKGFKFDFGYSDQSGMPVISFDDPRNTTITFELEDLLIPAMKKAGIM